MTTNTSSTSGSAARGAGVAAVDVLAALVEQMPAVGDALASGAVTAAHVDAIAHAAAKLDDAGKDALAGHADTLIQAATDMSPEAFDRECRDLARSLSGDDGLSRHERLRQERNVRRWVDKHTGAAKTLLSLDPATDAKVWTAINAAIGQARAGAQDDELTFDQLRADAVVDLITGARAVDRRVPEVSVLIDWATLVRDADGVCETSNGEHLPVSMVRRWCCDAEILPIVLGGDGEVLDAGRSTRLANRQQRRALRAMYATCAHPGCRVGFDDCRIHHADHWEHLGRTDLARLIPLCERHHHLVHEGGWSLTLDQDSARTVTLSRPDGTVHHHCPSIDRRPTHPAAHSRAGPAPPTQAA
ncbi:hypothetical protein BH24ACT5_BH24ACT5_25900 [soil metagenome]